MSSKYYAVCVLDSLVKIQYSTKFKIHILYKCVLYKFLLTLIQWFRCYEISNILRRTVGIWQDIIESLLL